MAEDWRTAFNAIDAAWSSAYKRHRASEGGVRETFFRAGFEAALLVIENKLELAGMAATLEDAQEQVDDALRIARSALGR